jgi:tripartite-type tricarboxylate transporter receptor subunit TctC
MKKNLSIFVKALSLFTILFLISLPVNVPAAGDYPNKPIQFIVGWEPGASEDLRVRALTPTMAKVLGQPVVVVNKPGASSGIGLTLIAKSKPDGYTIGNSSVSGLLFAPHTNKVEYDTMRDFTYIANTGVQPYAVVVRNDAPWKNFNEFIDHVKKNPGTVKYGVAGIGGMVHVYMEILAKEWGLKWDVVPFKGDQPNVTALLGGHIPVAAMSSAFVPQAKARKFRPLALITAQRMELYPDVPTLNDLGFKRDLRANEASGICGPKGLSSEVVEKLENAIKQAVDGPEFRKVMDQLDNEPKFRNSKAATELIHELYPKIGNMIKEVGLKKQ